MPTTKPTGGADSGEPTVGPSDASTETPRTRRRTTKTTSAAAEAGAAGAGGTPATEDAAPARSRRRAKATESPISGDSGTGTATAGARTRRRSTKATAAAAESAPEPAQPALPLADEPAPAPAKATRPKRATRPAGPPTPTAAPTETVSEPPRAVPSTAVVFMAPPAEPEPSRGAAEPARGVADSTRGGAEPSRTADEPSGRTRARGTKATGTKATGTKATGTRATAPKAAAPKATAAKAAPAKAAAGKTTAAKATGTKAAGTRTPAAKAAAAEPEPDLIEEAEAERVTSRRRRRRTAEPEVEPAAAAAVEADEEDGEDELDAAGRRRRRRGRRGRGRGKGTFDEIDGGEEPLAAAGTEAPAAEDDEEPLTRRRRRRRRSGSGEAEGGSDDGVVTVVKIRPPRGTTRDEVQGVAGSTRLEAKRQRRRDGREQRRTRPPILSESEFLARREAVDRVMVVRQKGDRTQVAVLEDNILVEHYVARQSTSTMVGNVYLGKVQNVLPSMEAAFVDIGRGRNAVLYAGEVNWDASGLEGRARSIEQALKSGESVLVQVTKDPVGHKGARLTSHIALSGRHLVYVPNGHASGISRKLSDVERRRLRDVLKNLVPDGAGVIVRTAAEGAAEDDLARDVKRLQAQWEDIQAKSGNGHAPSLLSAEPDLVIRVVRDLFNEDFREVVIQGTDAYEQVESYLSQVSPDLVSRVRRHTGPGDAFAEWRVDEQILKGLDRKVYLPSGGHLVIDRTEAMTVVDVNTGKYTGAGGNLEETVTRNNLEAAEEIVRQLRLRDLGGIVVIDFIDMVLESNRELVLRRLTECLGRDRTKHQVTEITSLGLVQMTRKRIGQGLLEAFSETCEHCKGRGVLIHTEPVAERPRTNVAEKVRAVAASTLGERNGLLESTEDGDVDAEGDEALMTVDDALDSDDEEAPTVRRRARRGGSRRRTRP